MTGELDARLLATFVEEIEDQVKQANRDLLALEEGDREPELVRSLFRVGHTVKGAARVVGLEPVERLCHAFEDFFAAVRDGELELRDRHFPLLFEAADALSGAAARLRAEEPPEVERLGDIRLRLERAARQTVVDPEPAAPGRPREDAGTDSSPEDGAGPAEGGGRDGEEGEDDGPDDPPGDETGEDAPVGRVRVHPGKLDRLLAASMELQVAAGGPAGTADELRLLRDRLTRHLAWWRKTARELGGALSEADGDRHGPILREIEEALRDAGQDAATLARRAEVESRALSGVTDEMVGAVRRLRMLSLSEAFEVLPRVGRDVARAEGKEVDVEVEGGDVEADRIVVETLREPLVHLVRNAVDHGIEAPDVREAAGKPRTGTVTIEGRRDEDRLVVTVADDGAGIDRESVRARIAEQRGDAPERDDDLLRILFQGGVSTRRETSEISGRGVGLNLVDSAMQRIRGTVEVDSTPGKGTRFLLRCPPTPSAVRALLVEVGGQLFAVPTWTVERLLRIESDAVGTVEGRSVVDGGDGPIPLVSMAELLGPPLSMSLAEDTLSVALLGDGRDRAGVVVGEAREEADLIVRPIRRCGAELPHLAGGALLPSGAVVLVVDVRELLRRAVGGAGAALAFEPREQAREAARVLVADDSLTTRALEQSVLESAGYRVVTAVDGADAWRKVQADPVDLVVSDVEMPRMDGFDLCRRIRGSAKLRDLPVILVTGLEDESQRERGLEIGADAYIGKSSFDQEALLETIEQLLR